jgi:tripartite-type tricarboxylate transporter receptor subunit TctC
MRRRDLLAAAPALLLARTAAAAFPDRDIAFVIPDGPGGGFDSYVRAIAPAMEAALPRKVNIVPTNVPGAGGARAASEIFRARPDGTMIGIFNVPGITVQQMRGAGGFDLDKFTWLGRAGEDHYALAVGANSPLTSIADLKALSQTRPIKFTSTGPAGTAYTATQIAAHLLGLRAQLITGYKGSSDYVVAAIRGDGDAVITALPLLRRMAAGNTLRIVASFEAQSTVPGVPDAQALGQPELGRLAVERLVAGPPGLPDDIKATIAKALSDAMKTPQLAAWAKTADADLSPATPEEAAAILREQTAFVRKWQGVLPKP